MCVIKKNGISQPPSCFSLATSLARNLGHFRYFGDFELVFLRFLTQSKMKKNFMCYVMVARYESAYMTNSI